MKANVADRIVQRLQGFSDALEKQEPLSKRFTLRKIALRLEQTSYSPRRVKETRKLLGGSQAIFAQFLGVSVQTVRSWEQGVNEPSDMARRFMDEIRHNPRYWCKRLKETIAAK